MKRLILTFLAVAYLAPQALRADVDQAALEEQPVARRDNFGSRVSEEAKRFRADEARTEKNFGEWVSSQRSHRPERHHGRPETAGDNRQNEANEHK